MMYNFIINTTVTGPLKLNVDSNMTTHDFMGCLLETIEDKTILYKNEVLDTDITEDKLEFVLFNHKAPEVQPILYTLNQLLKSKRTRTIGSNM